MATSCPIPAPACTLGAVNDLKAKGQRDQRRLRFRHVARHQDLRQEAFYVAGGGEIAPYLLKRDAEAAAAKSGAKVLPYDEAIKAAVTGG
jgi:NitT/TauT family transport system substrate-binding protein